MERIMKLKLILKQLNKKLVTEENEIARNIYKDNIKWITKELKENGAL